MPDALDRYRAQALREPFVLELDGGGVVRVEWPAWHHLLDAGQATTSRGLLDALCGDEAEQLQAAVAGEDYTVLQGLVEALREHFGLVGAPRISWILRRYGDSVKADLHRFYRVDLLDLWRGGLTPQGLLELVERLPRHSAYSEASAQDEEVAELAPDVPPAASIPLTEWTPEAEALWTVADRLAEVIRAVVETQGGKVGRIPSSPRPVTAFDRVRTRRRDAAYANLRDQLFPGTNGDEEV